MLPQNSRDCDLGVADGGLEHTPISYSMYLHCTVFFQK